jgi:nicotinamidase-related amidase
MKEVSMESLPLITPSDRAVVLVDYQAGLAFAAGSADRQGIRSAALALAKTRARSWSSTQVATASGWTTPAT